MLGVDLRGGLLDALLGLDAVDVLLLSDELVLLLGEGQLTRPWCCLASVGLRIGNALGATMPLPEVAMSRLLTPRPPCRPARVWGMLVARPGGRRRCSSP